MKIINKSRLAPLRLASGHLAFRVIWLSFGSSDFFGSSDSLGPVADVIICAVPPVRAFRPDIKAVLVMNAWVAVLVRISPRVEEDFVFVAGNIRAAPAVGFAVGSNDKRLQALCSRGIIAHL